jgi:regulatory protein YycH of two-component signal transduction system YycFG
LKMHTKSTSLAVLVVISVALSYVLWHGDWQNNTEVAYTDGSALPTAGSPTTADVSEPFQVVFSSVHPNQNSVGLPDSTLYHTWMQKLTDAHISGFRVVQVLPKITTTASVNFTFGTDVSYRDVTRWLPGLPESTLIKSMTNLILFETSDKKAVQLALTSGDGTYLADTDISATQFPKDVGLVTTGNPWVQWDPDNLSLIPKNGLTMSEVRYKTSQPQILPLVHSFFVNPQALSRIQETKETVLFTDGSRVVWWDQAGEILTYADPNSSQSQIQTQFQSFPTVNLSTSLEFVRNHGGSPSNIYAFRNDTSGKTSTYTLRPYVLGYPVFGSLSEYKTEMEAGKVVQFQRPLRDLGQKMDETIVHTFGADQLADILHRVIHNVPVSSLTVQIGYQEQVLSSDVVMLKPVYFVSQNGTTEWSIDASNGTIITEVREQ